MTEESQTVSSPDNSELEVALARIAELEAKLAESSAALEAPEESTVPKLSSYKVGDYVSVVVPNQVEKEDGRVIDEARKGQLLSVATAKGEVIVGSPDRIRKQGQSW